MNPKAVRFLSFFVLLLMPVLASMEPGPAWANAPIGKVSVFKGEVIMQSGDDVVRIGKPGQALGNGDHLLTRDGEAQVVFNDGAVMKLNSFSKVKVEEAAEETGFWVFKSKKPARRVTIFTGKAWFKSGASNVRNYVQTPAAVCMMRGSDGDFGYNPATMQTYLNMYSGESTVVGNVIRGFFDNPGISAAQKSAVYQALAQAYQKTEQARASGKAIDIAQARVDVLKAAKEAAAALQNNPDAKVKTQANVASATLDASIAAQSAKIAVEEIKDAKESVLKKALDARKAGDAKTALKLEQAARETDQARRAAEAAAAAAARAAEAAKLAANRLDLAATQNAANQAQAANDQAQQREKQVVQDLAKQGVITTTVPTTIATTTVATTVPPTTAPMTTTTTVEATTTTTTTTSTTTSSSTSTSTVLSPP